MIVRLKEQQESQQESFHAEIESLKKVFQEKILIMKDRESALNLEIAVAKKEAKTALSHTASTPKETKEDQGQLKQEVVRLRKFVNERQQEIFDLRKNTVLFCKKQKEAQDKLEATLKKQYKDNLSAQMKVLDLQLSKLEQLNKHLYH